MAEELWADYPGLLTPFYVDIVQFDRPSLKIPQLLKMIT